MRRSLVYLLLLGSLLLMIFGGATTAYTVRTRNIQMRGYADPTTTTDLPLRVPLAGVNVELTQYTDQQLESTLTAIANAHFVWVRQEFLWATIESVQGQLDFSHYDLSLIHI